MHRIVECLTEARLLTVDDASVQIAHEALLRTWPRLRGWIEERDVRLPVVPEHCSQGYHMYYMILPSLDARDSLIAHLRSRGIFSVIHYTPLHLSKMGLSFGGADMPCPVTEQTSNGLVRLPFHNDLTTGQQERVVGEIRAFFEN